MPRTLPQNPSVRFLQKEAKDILKAHKSSDPSCCPTLRYHFRFSRSADEEILKAEVSLQEVQHALALDYGCKSWAELKAGVEKDASSAVSVTEAAITGESIATDLIHAAVISRASDIHMEWIGGRMVVRYRIDGRMQESEKSIPDELQTAVITAIKEMADLDTETDGRLQNGRITSHIGDRELDLRVSVMPCVGGESAVLRILDPSHLNISLDRLGLTGENIATIKDWTQRPNGMFFVSGPTGSGKSTTLYSVLRDMDREEKKIITCEDPVEYVIDGINQQQVDVSKGITFHNTVREMMKQDPDVIMVGEIRDLDTLSCCVQMALTGHLVFSCLHTDDAAGAVRRLVDIGVEPYLVSSTLIGIMAQRLVRIICDNCREEYQPGPEVQQRLGALAGASVYRGRGCEKCGNTGYRGRIGIVEMLQMDDALGSIVGRKGSAAELREQAVKSGMIRMREDGLAKVAQGITTIDEVLRVTAGDAY